MPERYRTFIRADGNRVIWLDQPDYRFPPHSHRRDEHDDDVFVIRVAEMAGLAREIADDVVKHWLGDVTGPNNVWACVERAVIAALSESALSDEGQVTP